MPSFNISIFDRTGCILGYRRSHFIPTFCYSHPCLNPANTRGRSDGADLMRLNYLKLVFLHSANGL
jgi:hypothetical protein